MWAPLTRFKSRSREAFGYQGALYLGAAYNPFEVPTRRGARGDGRGARFHLDGITLPDGFTVIIGGAAARARFVDRLKDRSIGARAHLKRAGVIGRRRR